MKSSGSIYVVLAGGIVLAIIAVVMALMTGEEPETPVASTSGTSSFAQSEAPTGRRIDVAPDTPVAAPEPETVEAATPEPTPAPAPVEEAAAPAPTPAPTPAPVPVEEAATPDPTPTPVLVEEAATPDPTPAPVPVEEAATPDPTPAPVPVEEAATPEPTPAPVPVEEAATPEPTPAPAPVEDAATPDPTPTPVPVEEAATPDPTPAPVPVEEAATPDPTPAPALVEEAAAPAPTPAPVPVEEAVAPAPTPAPAPVEEAAAPDPTPALELVEQAPVPEPLPVEEVAEPAPIPDPSPVEEAVVPEPTAAEPEEQPSLLSQLIEQVIGSGDEPAEQPAPETPSVSPAVPAMVDQTPIAPTVPLPEFDVVRVDAAGNMVVAGRAAPNADVEILDRGERIGSALADERGDWVFLPDHQLTPGDRELSLRAVSPDGESLDSDRSVLVVVPELVQEQTAVETAELPEPAAPIILSAPSNEETAPVEILQAPTPSDADIAPISVDAVEYDETGNVGVSGRAEPETSVRVYLDDQPVGEVATSPEGEWSVEPPASVEPGLYRLRADQVDEEGDVTARVELPFQKESVSPDQFQPGQSYVVQPGNSLWRIARRTYGQGVNYVVIYQQNRDQIRDPNLIYPGQIFDLPKNAAE